MKNAVNAKEENQIGKSETLTQHLQKNKPLIDVVAKFFLPIVLLQKKKELVPNKIPDKLFDESDYLVCFRGDSETVCRQTKVY